MLHFARHRHRARQSVRGTDHLAGDLFSADLSGAWLNGRRLIAKTSTLEVSATIVSSFPSAQDLELFGTEALTAHCKPLDRFQAALNLGRAALDLAHVAAGWAEATMNFSTSPCDVAAGVLILEQAGGSYFGYLEGALESPSFLAPDYFGVGGGANYPTLRNIVEGLSSASKKHRLIGPDPNKHCSPLRGPRIPIVDLLG